MDKVSIKVHDNFLEKEKFDVLRDMIMGENFPWFFYSTTNLGEEPSTSPGQLVHVVYGRNVPQSSFYESDMLIPILDKLDINILLRIKMNLRTRLPNHFESGYHIDILFLHKDVAVNCTTSIFYINTNNGYTEFEGGRRIESIANRLVTFPLTTKHRGVTQTDEQARYVINFNYLKKQDAIYGERQSNKYTREFFSGKRVCCS